MREVFSDGDQSLVAQAVSISIDWNCHSTVLPGVIAGKVLFLLCDSFPLQNWCAENREALLDRISEAYSEVTVLRIYANTHK